MYLRTFLLYLTSFLAVSSVQAQNWWEHQSIPGKAVWTEVREDGGTIYMVKGANSLVGSGYAYQVTQCFDVARSEIEKNWMIRVNKRLATYDRYLTQVHDVKTCISDPSDHYLIMPIADQGVHDVKLCPRGDLILFFGSKSVSQQSLEITISVCLVDSEDELPPVVMIPGSTVVREGGTETFPVSLSTAPSSDVTVTISGHVGTDLEGTPPDPLSLTFTSANYSTAQTVTLTAGTDNDIADDHETLTLIASGGGYTNITKTIAVTIEDVDTAGFTVQDTVEVDEGGMQTFPVSLSAAPSNDVTVTISGHVGTDLEKTPPDPVSLTFTSTNYSTAQIVTLTASEDDDFADDSETLTLTASGGGYTDVTKTIAVTIEDVDTAGFTVQDTVEVDEGGMQTFPVSLSAAPSNDVTVTISGHVGTDLEKTPPDPVSLTFTSTNYSTAQTVTLTASEDNDLVDDHEKLELTASGGGYINVTETVEVTIVDSDDPPSTSVTVTLHASTTRANEGKSISLEARLSSPLQDVVTIYLLDTPGEPPTEPGDYSSPDRITIPGGAQTGSVTIDTDDDDVSEGEERFTVAINGSRLPSEVTLGAPSSVEITIVDNDQPPPVEVSLSVDPSEVDEGSSVKVTATLTGELESAVTVPLDYNNQTNRPPEPGDYVPLEYIRIPSGKREESGFIETFRDGDIEDENFLISLGDLPKDLLSPDKEVSQQVTIRDLSTREVRVRLSALPNPVNEGTSVTVTAILSEPYHTGVTIPLTLTNGTTDDQDYQVPTPHQIMIEAGDRRGTHTIPIVDDNIDEDYETFTVALAILPDGLVNGEQPQVEIRIKDNDEAGIKVPSEVSVVEEGTKPFYVSLTSEPLEEVTVTITWRPSDTGLTIQPTTLIFMPENWEVGEKVKLSAMADEDIVDNSFEVTLKASGSRNYSDIFETVSVTIEDNDRPNILVQPVTIDEGGRRPLDIALTQKPSGPVTVTVSGYEDTDLTDTPPSPMSLTFTPSDYSIVRQMMLTAATDDDLMDDYEMLTLTASGGGYRVMREVYVTIRDHSIGAILTAPSSVTVDEGDRATFDVWLQNPPTETVMVTLSGHTGTDLSLDKSSLAFTPVNWSHAQKVTVTAVENDNNYTDDTETLRLTASNGGYDGVTKEVQVTIRDNDQEPLTISVYDKRELEDEGAIQLPIELSRTSDQVVTVQYASADIEAEAGLDYTASRGLVIFDPGATQGIIEIKITDDELPESTETFTVTLSNSRNAFIARATGTGTILDNDGGAAILRVEDALVLEEEEMVQFRVLLTQPQDRRISAAYRTRDGTAKAGEDYEASSGIVTLAPGVMEALITVPLLKGGLDWQEETFTVHLESSEDAEILRSVGVATIQESTTANEAVLEAYTARFVRTASVQVVEALGERFRSGAPACGAAVRAEMAQLWNPASSWDPSLGELLAGCHMSASSYSGAFSVWGQGAFRHFNGREDTGLTLSGEVTTGMLGADYRWGSGWLAGVLLSHSQGKGSFESGRGSGEITAGLTGLYPYVSYARTGWDLWLSAGMGRGQAEAQEREADLVLRFGAIGVRGTLVSGGTIGLNYHGDVLVTDAEIEDHAMTVEVVRVRAGVEANMRMGDKLRPYAEANVRSDGGSAETGIGLEFGGGLRFAHDGWRMRGDVYAQGLVMHTVEGFTEWGISGSLQVGNQSEGLMMRVRPSWGRGQGMFLYGRQTILDAVPVGANGHRTELELGYGVPWKEGAVRSIMGVTQLPQGRMYRLGGEIHPWDRMTFSAFGLTHGRMSGNIGVNVQGSLRY